MTSISEISQSNNTTKTKDINQLVLKANKIHLELLSLIQKELIKNKKIVQNFGIFSIKDNIEINKEEKNYKYIRDRKGSNKEIKTNIISDESDEDEEQEEESSSEMSGCDEECIRDVKH